MVITLSSGLQVTVPNDQFMVPFVTIDRNGSRIFNESQREFLFNPTLDRVHLPTLGRYFLTSAYLMVNHDAQTFTLWQANPSTTSQLVPVLGDKTKREACDSNSTTGTPQPSATNPSVTPDGTPGGTQSPRGKSLSTGIVAAIAVVSVVAVGLTALWIFYVVRRRRKADRLHEVAAQQSVPEENTKVFRQPTVHEMHSESRPYEVQGSEGMVYELEGRVAR
jgi:hypothetical protein